MILTGAGQIGMAIARRMGYGMKIVVGDKRMENAQSVADTMNRAGFDVLPVEMDLSSRESILHLIDTAQQYGEIAMLVNAAGVSPSQASIETILKVVWHGCIVGRGRKSHHAGRYRRYNFQSIRTSSASTWCGN